MAPEESPAFQVYGNLALSPAINGSTQKDWDFYNKCKTLFYGTERSASGVPGRRRGPRRRRALRL
jgi:hypothetical protein